MWRNIFALASVRGRANRAAYWKAILLVYGGITIVVLLIVYASKTGVLSGSQNNQIVAVAGTAGCAVFFVCLWIGWATTVRRLHDRDKSWGWAFLFTFVPASISSAIRPAAVVGPLNPEQAALGIIPLGLLIWGFIEIGCLRGTSGDNRFGSDPLASKPSASEPRN